VSTFAKRWRDWTTLVIGGYLLFSPWIFDASGDEASSANAWLTGGCVVIVTLWALLEAGPRTGKLTRVWIGAWLLVSPFALGFALSVMAWNAWIAGVLMVALSDIPNLSFDFLSWLHAQELRYQARNTALGKIVRYVGPEHPMGPEQLCWHIVECSYQIRRTLLGQTSGEEVGMCILGYRACVNDSITLNRLIDKELPESGLLRRLRLKIAWRQAARSLALAREALPPGAPTQ
jgi:hypothetical protein